MSILLTVLEIACCSAAAGLTSFFILERREARHLASVKAEELYTLVDAFDQSLISHFSRRFSQSGDDWSYQQNGDADWNTLMRDAAKARMLISFYFPALWPHVSRADAAVTTSVAAMRRYHSSRKDEAAVVSLEQALLDMREALQALKHEVVMTHRDGGKLNRSLRMRPTGAEAKRLAA
jgi:hypothetical protein